MFSKRHLTDAELLLVEESGLSQRRLARARRHLAVCRRCALRRDKLSRAAADLSREFRDAEPALPMPDAAREKLRARLDATRASRDESQMLSQWVRPVSAGLAAAIVFALLLSIDRDANEPAPSMARDGVSRPGPALPRPDLTPGAVRQISVEEICQQEQEAHPPLVDIMTAQQVFEYYGADFRRAEEYELDFLITPELGGTADIRNLWPQPYGSTTWNAHVKDELEHLFRERVCDGTMDIRTAQREIATDWISAYRRYFETDRPRPAGTRRDG